MSLTINLPPLRRAHLKLDLVALGATPIAEHLATDWHVPDSSIIHVPILGNEGWFVIYDDAHASTRNVREVLREAGLTSTIFVEL